MGAAHRGDMSLHDFEQSFLPLFANMPLDLPGREATAMNEMFWAIESYVEDASIRESGDIDAAALREAIAATLEATAPQD